ncbi:hypothetical protein LJC58_06510 [Lachnospiraceae bacterium OttesenSCG-928-D06]|nr:hypothetical protein [Lachnospiraceae bacterium OttesenSCG-928-D06]
MEAVTMTISGIIKKGDKKLVRISFQRGKDYAEGIVPGGEIEKSAGFTKEELDRLRIYMQEQQGEIYEQAKGINPIKGFMGK